VGLVVCDRVVLCGEIDSQIDTHTYTHTHTPCSTLFAACHNVGRDIHHHLQERLLPTPMPCQVVMVFLAVSRHRCFWWCRYCHLFLFPRHPCLPSLPHWSTHPIVETEQKRRWGQRRRSGRTLQGQELFSNNANREWRVGRAHREDA